MEKNTMPDSAPCVFPFEFRNPTPHPAVTITTEILIFLVFVVLLHVVHAL